MKNNKMKKTILALSLVTVLGLGGTLAYLNSVTETKTNTFTSDNTTVDGKIEEIEWEKTGKKQAESYTPGEVIAKDPVVTLEADSEGAFVAMKLDFKDSKANNMKYADFQKYASHNGIAAGWELIAKTAEGSELYAYNPALAAGTSTDAIFTQVTVNGGITTVKNITETTRYKLTTEYDAAGNVVTSKLVEDKEAPVVGVTYYDADGNVIGEVQEGNVATKLPKFEIAVTGVAVQSQNLDYTKAKAELIKLANAGKTAGNKDYYVAV